MWNRILATVAVLSFSSLMLALSYAAVFRGSEPRGAEVARPSAPIAGEDDLGVDEVLQELREPREPDMEPGSVRRAQPEPSRELPGSQRVPNLERVAGRSGKVIRGEWPDGTRMFLAHQERGRSGWKLDGPWQSWHPNGELEELGGYRDGREHGDWQWWYDSGAPMAEGHFEDGVRVGRWLFWHPDGTRMAEGSYRDGRNDGRWTFWYADGTEYALASGEYRGGVLVR